jgi:3alpha(or 20beta)-hydroxysteroid dehydrogenase
VAVLGRHRQNIEAIAEEVGGKAFEVDVSDTDRMASSVEQASEWMGGLTGLFNNAAAAGMGPVHEWSRRRWDLVLQVNLTGVYNGIRAAVPLMLRSGGVNADRKGEHLRLTTR